MSNVKECSGNNEEQEIIYTNDDYRVEKIQIKTGDELMSIYGVFSNTYGVLELETTILAKALNTCDELSTAVSTFFQSKAFDNIGSGSGDSPLIETV